MRTEDLNYGEDYWHSLDGGGGYQDAPYWQDLAHIIKETFIISGGRDRSKETRILDIGAGFCYLVKHLRARGIETFGIDISEYAISQAPPEVKEFCHVRDITVDEAIPGAPADLAVCLETLEHIPEDRIPFVFMNLSNMLVPGGTLFLSICVEENSAFADVYSDPTHITIRSRQWWDTQPALNQHFTIDYGKMAEIQKYHMFSHHHGLYILIKK